MSENSENNVNYSTDRISDITEEDLLNDIPRCERIIEAILFAAGHPVLYTSIAEALNIPVKKCMSIVRDYAEKYNSPDCDIQRGVMMIQFPDSCQLCTKEEYNSYIKR